MNYGNVGILKDVDGLINGVVRVSLQIFEKRDECRGLRGLEGGKVEMRAFI